MYMRFEVRKAMRVPIDLVSACWDEPVELKASDFSPRGLFVRTGVLALDRGEPVVISFRMGPGKREVSLFGEVARVSAQRRGGDLGDAGIGIRFVDTRPIDRIRLREWLRGVPPPLPPRRPCPVN